MFILSPERDVSRLRRERAQAATGNILRFIGTTNPDRYFPPLPGSRDRQDKVGTDNYFS